MRSTCGCPAAFGGSVAPRGMSGISKGVYPGRYSGISKSGPAFASMAGIRRPVPSYGAAPAVSVTSKPTSVVWADGDPNKNSKGGKNGRGGGGGFSDFAEGATSIIDAVGNFFGGRRQQDPGYAPAPPQQAVPNWVWYAAGAAVIGGAVIYARG